MNLDERIALTFAVAWVGLSAVGAAVLWAQVHWMAGLFWAWAFTGLATWAASSRVPPRGDRPEPRESPDFSDDTPIHTVE